MAGDRLVPGQRLELEPRPRLGLVRVDEVLARLRAVVVRLAVVRDRRVRRLVARGSRASRSRSSAAPRSTAGSRPSRDRARAARPRGSPRATLKYSALSSRSLAIVAARSAVPSTLLAELRELAVGARDLGEPELVQLRGRHRDADVIEDRRAVARVAVGQRRRGPPCSVARLRQHRVAQEVAQPHDRRLDLVATTSRSCASSRARRPPATDTGSASPTRVRHRPRLDRLGELGVELLDRRAAPSRPTTRGRPRARARDSRSCRRRASRPAASARSGSAASRGRLHGVRLDEIRQLAEHAAAAGVDEPLVEAGRRRGPCSASSRPRSSWYVTRSASPSRAGVDRAELARSSASRSASHALDRGRVARREPVVVAMIAERRRPRRRPPHHVLPVIGDHRAAARDR